MKTLIIYKSIHLGSTKKIAEALGKALQADVFDAKDITANDFDSYDLIGIGSGIYDGGFHKAIYHLIDKVPGFEGKKIFLFSTAGVIYDASHREIRNKLMGKQADIIGDYYCKGLNKNSFLKYIGGMNKGRPNASDIERAKEFARKLII